MLERCRNVATRSAHDLHFFNRDEPLVASDCKNGCACATEAIGSLPHDLPGLISRN
ncbi:uncharacterized protein BKA78DRAFT_315226 [Phyllosticta capitalensis]|uniref:uncharacterized protein n=1 Tax=Phyllosticta capitalensis TaxID=121624 RepID=UPI0031309690